MAEGCRNRKLRGHHLPHAGSLGCQPPVRLGYTPQAHPSVTYFSSKALPSEYFLTSQTEPPTWDQMFDYLNPLRDISHSSDRSLRTRMIIVLGCCPVEMKTYIYTKTDIQMLTIVLFVRIAVWKTIHDSSNR